MAVYCAILGWNKDHQFNSELVILIIVYIIIRINVIAKPTLNKIYRNVLENMSVKLEPSCNNMLCYCLGEYISYLSNISHFKMNS